MQAYSPSSGTNSDLQGSTVLDPVDLLRCNQGVSNNKINVQPLRPWGSLWRPTQFNTKETIQIMKNKLILKGWLSGSWNI